MVFPTESAINDALRGHDHETVGVGMTGGHNYCCHLDPKIFLKILLILPIRFTISSCIPEPDRRLERHHKGRVRTAEGARGEVLPAAGDDPLGEPGGRELLEVHGGGRAPAETGCVTNITSRQVYIMISEI